MSHSWHDAGAPKWAALDAWARAFERREGRPCRWWIDKACIDQTNITEDLAALPIFLSGCQRLVICAGATYLERLWCIVEVYTFLKMGGSVERIDVLPVGDGALQAKLRAFDAHECKCFKEEDRQRLLGAVEAGFGHCRRFNALVKVELGAALGRLRS